MGYPAIDAVTRKHGPEAAKELSVFMAKHMYAMKHVVEKEKLNCDYLLDRYVETFLDQSDADNMKEIYEGQLEAGLDYIEDVSLMNPKYVERVSPVPVLHFKASRNFAVF
jgi:hypothetical protein